MNIITKQRDEKIKHFNPFKVIFCKYKDKKEKEDKIKVIEEPKKTELFNTEPKPICDAINRTQPRTFHRQYEEAVAKTFNKYRIGDTIIISNTRYTVLNIPNLDYSRTYLPLFLLLKNGFLKEN